MNNLTGLCCRAALQAALHSGAHTVLVRNLGTPWLVTSVLWLGSNQITDISPLAGLTKLG